MKKLKLAGIYILIIAVIIFGFYKLALAFSPSSYPNAEIYDLDFSQKEVLSAIEKVKKNENKLTPVKDFFDSDSSDNFNHIYFNLGKNTILTFTRQINKNKTEFGFVSIRSYSSEWKQINEDFSYIPNIKIKKKFEQDILKKVKFQLNKKK